MFLSEWCEFPSAPCLAVKKLDDSSRLDVVEIARVPDVLLSCFCFLSGLRTYQHSQYVDCTTGYTTEGSQFDFAQGQRIFLSSETSLPITGHTQPLIRLAPEIKRPRNEFGHSSPSSAESENEWSYTSTPLTRPLGMLRGNFAFFYTLRESRRFSLELLVTKEN